MGALRFFFGGVAFLTLFPACSSAQKSIADPFAIDCVRSGLRRLRRSAMEAVSTGPRRLRPLQGSAQLTCKGLRKVLCTEACPFHSNDGKCNDGGDTDVKEAAVRLERRVAHTQPLRGINNSNTKSPRPLSLIHI